MENLDKDLELIKIENPEYMHLRRLTNDKIIGVLRMVFTVGLFYDIDEAGYQYRFCYHSFAECMEAYNKWDGIGNPAGNWIKCKGANIDYVNPNYIKDQSYSS